MRARAAALAIAGAGLITMGCDQMPVGAVADAKKLAASELRDPASAQFRNVREVTTAAGKAVCGEINAKNAYGGYVGFQDFVVADGQAWIQTGADASSSVEDLNAETESIQKHTERCY